MTKCFSAHAQTDAYALCMCLRSGGEVKDCVARICESPTHLLVKCHVLVITRITANHALLLLSLKTIAELGMTSALEVREAAPAEVNRSRIHFELIPTTSNTPARSKHSAMRVLMTSGCSLTPPIFSNSRRLQFTRLFTSSHMGFFHDIQPR